jgi:hypothetical protein
MLVFSSGLMTFRSRSNPAGAAGLFHLGFELLHLLLHESGLAGRAADADLENVLHVGLRDGVGRVRRQLRIGRAVRDQHQIRIGRARDG